MFALRFFFFFLEEKDGIRNYGVIVEMLCAFREIGQVLVGQVDEKLLHVFASQLDEIAPHAIAYAPRTAVQHKPNTISFIEANFDEVRSEEHTSELQSHSDLVCRLLLEKKNENQECLAYVERFRILADKYD